MGSTGSTLTEIPAGWCDQGLPTRLRKCENVGQFGPQKGNRRLSGTLRPTKFFENRCLLTARSHSYLNAIQDRFGHAKSFDVFADIMDAVQPDTPLTGE